MSRNIPVRPLPHQVANNPVPNPAPVLAADANQGGAAEAQLRADVTLHVCSLWGQLIVKVARAEAKENKP
jgi:hypothetical protein